MFIFIFSICMGKKIKVQFKQIVKSVESKLMYLMVGCECNRSRLIQLVCSENLYETVDVVTCIDDFMSKT